MRVMKRSARTKDSETWRVSIAPIRLSGADYRRAHEACHKAASLWNFFLASIQEYWKENETDPTESDEGFLFVSHSLLTNANACSNSEEPIPHPL